MKTDGLNKEKEKVIIETFADYVENYYDEDNEPDDVSSIVNEHFKEFTEWAFEDFVINEAERESLLISNESGLQENIKKEVVNEFAMILNSK
ncbi:MAG: hypothetical protein GY790_14555 [Bacteroidetes bacterium]|nr:hypothetical protein [Bacteroidota bacterium]